MRFEIGPGGMFVILLGLAGLSGAVFGLGLIAGHELAGPEAGSPSVTAAYPLPQTAPPAVEASAPAMPAAVPAASTAALAPPASEKAGASGVNAAAINPAVPAPAASLKPRTAAETAAHRTVETRTNLAARPTRPAATADEDLTAGSSVAPPRETRSASAESAATAPSASDMDEGAESSAPPVQPRRKLAAVSPPSPQHAATGPYSVQIDAMMDWQGAQQMAQKIRAKGFQPYIVPTYVQGKTWYRLRVGHYATPEQAQAAESRLHEEFNQ
jgi:DedD protein